MTRLGRKPQGAGLVTPLPGSAHAKRRLTLFLQTLSGQCSVGEACTELGIGESRFFAQRAAWLEQSLALLEPRTAGRPPKLPLLPDEREVKVLREQVRQLEARLAAAEVRSELACLLPRVVGAACAGKKNDRGWPLAERDRPSTPISTLSPLRRRARQRHNCLRLAETLVRQRVVSACQAAEQRDVPVLHVTRRLALPDRTVRRWRKRACTASLPCMGQRGRLPRAASRAERNQVYQFLRQRGVGASKGDILLFLHKVECPLCSMIEQDGWDISFRKAGDSKPRYAFGVTWPEPE